jgi:hypothetical protein
MEVSVRELIRETKNAVNARFDMLEHVLHISNVSTEPVHDNSKVYQLLHQQNEEIDSIKTMLYRFNDVISNIMRKIETMENYRVKELTPLPSFSEVLPHLVISSKAEVTARSHSEVLEESEEQLEEEQQEEDNEQQEEDNEQQEEEDNEQQEEQQEEEDNEQQEEEQHEEEQEEEEEGVELEEFEYKGMTLYRDTENRVYRMDEDGALSDPLGLWDESGPKPRIKKII